MTAGTFTERIAGLRRAIGTGTLHGEVEVDQVYAHYQHERLDLRHPRGGHARYLEAPFLARYRKYLRAIADDVLRDGGHAAMIRSMEDLSDQAEWHAPVEFADLRRSGHPKVTQGLRTLYDRPPRQHRLSEAELRAKNRLRKLPPQLIGWIWWHVMHKQEPPPHLR